MGTRRSKHNKGRKPLYKEHRLGVDGALTDTCADCSAPSKSKRCRACYTKGSRFLAGERARALTIEAVTDLSESAAYALFCKVRWPETDGAPQCPECGCSTAWSHTRSSGLRRYECADCEADFTATSGTPFSHKKKTYRELLLSIIAIHNPEATGKTRAEIIGYADQGSAQKLMVRFRERMGLPQPEQETFEIGSPRYYGGAPLSTRTWWTDGEKSALRRFVELRASPDQASVALGRSASSLKHYLREIGNIQIPPEWSATIRKPRESRVDLQFPYIAKARDEHADILAVNDLIPRSIPPHMRSDIVQEIMLAMLEGRITLETIKAKRDSVRWFVTKFYKDNFEQAGHAMSLTGVDGDGEDYDLLSRISADEWRVEQMNEKRRAFDAVNHRFFAPTQIEDVYHYQVRNEQRRLHHDEAYLGYTEAADELDRLDPKTLRHMDRDFGIHAVTQLRERYGVIGTHRDVFLALRDAAMQGRVHVVKEQLDGTSVGWARVMGRNVRVLIDSETKDLITVLPPKDERKTYRESVRERAEALFT